MTFWATWVVVKIVATHLRNPVVGNASGTRGCIRCGDDLGSVTWFRTFELSNQNRHVICAD
jgi:hypothetical protein